MGIKDDRKMQNDYQASKHILTSFDRLSPTIMNKKYRAEARQTAKKLKSIITLK